MKRIYLPALSIIAILSAGVAFAKHTVTNSISSKYDIVVMYTAIGCGGEYSGNDIYKHCKGDGPGLENFGGVSGAMTETEVCKISCLEPGSSTTYNYNGIDSDKKIKIVVGVNKYSQESGGWLFEDRVYEAKHKSNCTFTQDDDDNNMTFKC